jgi:hypothetical protein
LAVVGAGRLLTASLFALLVPYVTIEAAGQQREAPLDSETYMDPYFGVTIDIPRDWYHEADNPWEHTHVTPWHLPLIPIKELQPTAVDILRDQTKTLVVHLEPGDETSSNIRVSVEKMPSGTSLDDYVRYTKSRIERNNDNVKFEETSSTTLAGNPAVKLVTTTSTVSEDFSFSARTMQVVTLYGNLAYIVEYHGSLEYYDLYLDVAESAMQSTRINPPVSYAQMLSLPLIGSTVAMTILVSVKSRKRDSATRRFLRETRRMFPSAFGIEVLCVASAEIGGLVALSTYGFNAFGITMAYVMAYALAGFATFLSILGRTRTTSTGHQHDSLVSGCAGFADHESGHSTMGFASALKQTFVDIGAGLNILPRLHELPNSGRIVRASLLVLLSAESGCIIAAATVDVMLYQYSAFLSIPIALSAGTLTVAFLAAYRSAKRRTMESAQSSRTKD